MQALQIIGPRTAIPIHCDDYNVFHSPLADLRAAVTKASLPTAVVYLAHGETYRLTTG